MRSELNQVESSADTTSVSTMTGASSPSSSIVRLHPNLVLRWCLNLWALVTRGEGNEAALSLMLAKRILKAAAKKLLLSTMSTKRSSGTWQKNKRCGKDYIYNHLMPGHSYISFFMLLYRTKINIKIAVMIFVFKIYLSQHNK